MGNTSSKAELVDRAKDGDELALTMLLTAADARLRRRLAPKIPADMRAVFGIDDLVQLIHTDVFRGIAGFQPADDHSFDRWLSRIATRRLQQEIRRHRAQKRPPERRRIVKVTNDLNRSTITLLKLIEAVDRTPSSVAARHEADAAVSAAMKELPEDYRAAVRMVYLEGFTAAEAAEAMGRTNRAIHNLCLKAKKKLHDMLGSESRFLSR